MTFRPAGDRILVEAEAVQETTESGLIVAEAAQNLWVRATVTAVGRGRRNEAGALVPLDYKVGDIVLIHAHSVHPFKVDGVELKGISPADILGIIEDDE